MTHLVFSFCYLLSICFWNHLEAVLSTTKILSCTIKLLAHTSLACKSIRFSPLFAAGDVSRGGTSATQRQKFHTDDANQCLHKSGSYGVPNINLSNFTCLLVDFGKFCVHLPTSSSKSQMLLLEKTIFHKH